MKSHLSVRTIFSGLLLLAGIVVTTPIAAQRADPPVVTAPEIQFTQWKLANGLTVIALPDPTTATVTTSMWYQVGAKNDPEGRSGFAHLFEHILNRKSENMPYGMINQLAEDIGGSRNASTGYDRTNYYETVPAQYLETLLWTHAERMARPVIDQDVFENERSVVKEELRQGVLTPPYGVMQRYVFFENAYDLLPQRRSNIGIVADLDAATLDEARAFHQAYYGPDTAVLIVAGNFDVANLRALVDKYFAAIPARARPLPIAVATREARRTTPRNVAATAPTVPLPALGTIYQLPEATHADWPALTVLDAVLSAGENSRLQRALVRTGKAVQAAEMLFSSREGGFLATFALASPAANQKEIAGLLSAEHERARTEPITEEELREARNQLFSAALTRRQTPAGRAFELGEALMTQGDVRAADRQLRAIGQVTAADVQRVAREWLRPDGVVTFTYTQGSGGAASYANPVPLPRFGSLPPAVGKPTVLRDEASRQAPPLPAAAPRVAKPEIVDATLANGIRVVSVQTGTVPLATMSVVLPGGTATDPADKAGLSELAAVIANKGTPTRTAEQIAATLESLGASMGASPGPDGVVFSVTAPAANLAAAGEVMADVIRNASYPDADVERERARIVNGLRVGLRDAATLAALAAPRVFYGSAPYGSIATVDSIPRITRSDLLAWREANWHPATARVVVSGGIPPAETQRIADRLFGGWRSAAPAPRAVANPAGTAPAPRTIVIDLPGAAQAMVYAGVRTTNRAGTDYYPLDIANSVLGLSSTSRLNTEVRMKRGLSYSARSSMPARAGEAVLSATVQTQNATVDEVVQIVLDQFAALGTKPADEAALQLRRVFMAGAVGRALETSGGFNAVVTGLLLQGQEAAEVTRAAERWAAVTPEAAAAVARRYVTPERTSLIVVGNAAEFVEDLRKIRPDLVVIPAAKLDLSSAALSK